MKLTQRNWVTAVVLGSSILVAPAARGDDWKAEHAAGWKAYKEGRLDAAEQHLLQAEKLARAIGANDPQLATTLDHLAWVLPSEDLLGGSSGDESFKGPHPGCLNEIANSPFT